MILEGRFPEGKENGKKKYLIFFTVMRSFMILQFCHSICR